MRQQKERENSSAIPTAGELFPDGTAIELLRDPGNPEKLTLLLCRNGILDTKCVMSHANRVYAPVSVDPIVSNALCFPTRVASPESTKKLFMDVHDLLRRYLGQLDPCITAMVFEIFASWISPALLSAPILLIFAPAGSPKNLTLQLLALLCRRPLRLAGVKRGDLLRVPISLQPTLLLDEPDLQPAMQSILQAGSHRGWYVPSGKGVRHLFGPKIICSRKLPLGTEFEANALRVSLIPVSGQLPILDKKAEEKIADEFQSRFLGYLLRNFNRVQVPNFDVSGLTDPVQALACAFGAAVVGDEELQAKILPLLKVQDEEIRSDRASSFDSIVIEAILFLSIRADGPEFAWTVLRVR